MLHLSDLSPALRRTFYGVIFVSFMAGAVGGALFGVIGGMLVSKTSTRQPLLSAPLSSSPTTIAPLAEPGEVVDVVRRVNPAVVSIIITKNIPATSFNPFSNPNNFFDNFFGYPAPAPRQQEIPNQFRQVGGGSGFFVSADGLIVTNKHVVADESAQYTVVTNDGNRHEAKVLARDSVTDLAVVKIEGTDFPTLPFGDSTSIELGQSVIAIGNALGEFSNTVSTGVVSGLFRSVIAGGSAAGLEQLSGVIQTDAAINPGNSGGPLLNLKGEVIGINTAVAQNAQNIGFAIPINEAKQVVESVQESGRIVRPFLGVRYVILTPDIAKDKQLPVDYGALIVRGETQTDVAVTPGSPADKAGLKENDIILEINDKKVSREQPLANLIAGFGVGDTITVKVLQKGTQKDLKVTLVERK